jgi:hypothetical protein
VYSIWIRKGYVESWGGITRGDDNMVPGTQYSSNTNIPCAEFLVAFERSQLLALAYSEVVVCSLVTLPPAGNY